MNHKNCISDFLNYRKNCLVCKRELEINCWSVPPADILMELNQNLLYCKASFDNFDYRSDIKLSKYNNNNFSINMDGKIKYANDITEGLCRSYFTCEALNINMICNHCRSYSYYSKFWLYESVASGLDYDIFLNKAYNKSKIDDEVFSITDYNSNGEECNYTIMNDYINNKAEMSVRMEDNLDLEVSYRIPIIPFSKYDFNNHDLVVEKIKKMAVLL